MSETKYVTDRNFQRLSERVSRLTKELSDVRRSIIKIEAYLSPGLTEELPDLDQKEKVVPHSNYSK